MQNAFDGVIDLYLSALSSALSLSLSLSCFTETGTTVELGRDRVSVQAMKSRTTEKHSLGHRHRAAAGGSIAFLLLPILAAAKTIKKAITKKIPPERDIQTKQAAAA